ncbi:hypothetical protein HPB49_024944 [Dermacentor silvarum]|uniref:Uncharacterized protein n=1 Tax=Dermacentor silvarum TaxID=543639 RepID=A0ACB8CNE1_DERSI|nr:hypothetical protein HPB49_024944 [Dermacentor silvarum]
MNDERWARRVFRYTTLKGVSTQWSRRLYDLCRKFSLLTDPVQEDSERKCSLGARTRVQEAETPMWQAAMDQKSSLALHRVHKTTISVERLYDNSVSSALLFQTRAGALRTKVYRRRFDQSADDSMCSAGHAGMTRRTLNTLYSDVVACALINQKAPHFPSHLVLWKREMATTQTCTPCWRLPSGRPGF